MDRQLNLIFVLRYRSFLHKNKAELPAIVRGVRFFRRLNRIFSLETRIWIILSLWLFELPPPPFFAVLYFIYKSANKVGGGKYHYINSVTYLLCWSSALFIVM